MIKTKRKRLKPSHKPIDHRCDRCSSNVKKPGQRKDLSRLMRGDDQIFCETCQTKYDGLCPHNHQIYYKDSPLSSLQLLSPQRAKLTCPRSIYCGRSRIPGAGLGIFTSKPLKAQTFFGPYLGVRHRSSKRANASAYAWTIEHKNGRVHSYVDALDKMKSNWLRYVNCPCTQKDENLIPIQYNGNIFYKTSRSISPGEELLVYYGDDYARALGLQPWENPARQ